MSCHSFFLVQFRVGFYFWGAFLVILDSTVFCCESLLIESNLRFIFLVPM